LVSIPIRDLMNLNPHLGMGLLARGEVSIPIRDLMNLNPEKSDAALIAIGFNPY